MRNLYFLITALIFPHVHPIATSGSESHKVDRSLREAEYPNPKDMLVALDPEPDLGSGFVSLYNGENLDGWIPKGGYCELRPGDTIVNKNPGSPSTYLSTNKADYQDFVFTAELKWIEDGNTASVSSRFAPAKKGRGPRDRLWAPSGNGGFFKERYWSGGVVRRLDLSDVAGRT